MVLHQQDCLENAFCIHHFRYIPCVALFLRVTGFPFLGTRSLHSGASSVLAMQLPFCCLLPLRTFFNLSLSKITVYSSSAPNTKIIQAITQHSMAVRPSALTIKNIHILFMKMFCFSKMFFFAHLWTVRLYRVVNVDQHEENCHQQSHSSRNYFGIDEKTNKNVKVQYKLKLQRRGRKRNFKIRVKMFGMLLV